MNNENYEIIVDSFWLPKAASTVAPHVDQGWTLALWVSYVFFAIVVVGMAVLVWKYRRKSANDRTSNAEHSTALEIGWSVGPLVILIWCFLVGFRGYIEASIIPEGAYEISVTASKWRWNFAYPNGKSEVNELKIPAGRPVKLIMSSSDVVHSLFIPEYRVKQDVVPGQYTTVWFEVPEPGKTRLLCTEFCGTAHSDMLANVEALAEEDFEAWLEAGDGGDDLPPEELGEKLFAKFTCNACHSTTDNLARVGPSVKGIFGRTSEFTDGSSLTVDENYLRESIENPGAKLVKGFGNLMPAFKGQLKDRDLDALIAYLKSLD